MEYEHPLSIYHRKWKIKNGSTSTEKSYHLANDSIHNVWIYDNFSLNVQYKKEITTTKKCYNMR